MASKKIQRQESGPCFGPFTCAPACNYFSDLVICRIDDECLDTVELRIPIWPQRRHLLAVLTGTGCGPRLFGTAVPTFSQFVHSDLSSTDKSSFHPTHFNNHMCRKFGGALSVLAADGLVPAARRS